MMRLIIISILLLSSAKAQDYVYYWVGVPKETNVINYQIQKSTNNITFTTIPNGTISPKKGRDSNKYSYVLPATDNFWRLKTLMTNTTLYTVSKKVVNTNVSITNAVLKINITSDNISFTATNEGQASYYAIQRKNSSSSQWVLVGKLTQTNKKNYVVNISKVGSLRSYRLQVVYYNGIVGPYISFE